VQYDFALPAQYKFAPLVPSILRLNGSSRIRAALLILPMLFVVEVYEANK
jgi:hypothetical protein